MSKIKKFFKAIFLISKNPYLLNHILYDEQINKEDVIKKYNLPKGLPCIDILELIPEFTLQLEPISFSDGGSTPLDLALLKSLAQSFPACQYFEIGTWRGESAAIVSSVAENVYTLNLSDEEMKEMGLQENYIMQHRMFSNGIENITHLQGNSLTYHFAGLNKKFDLIFIDGDHHYESVKSDTQNAFKLLRNENSIIVWHDYGHSPTDVRWDVLKGILDGTPPDKLKNVYRVSNTLCAIYTTKNVKSEFLQPFTKPNKFFTLHLSAKKM
ncbi:MAG: class I SAM-dependent methyltransferase [Flavobacteriales bacterium]|nr:class I SAM-dependent methyltransferase [Flavobacteriales bacterium]